MTTLDIKGNWLMAVSVKVCNLCKKKYSIDVERQVKKFLAAVPDTYLRGLRTVNLCDYPPKWNGKLQGYNERGGDYNNADGQCWINLYLTPISSQTTKWRFNQRLELTETLAHELGHHIVEFINKQHKDTVEKEEKKAQEYEDMLVAKYYWRRYWWLVWWIVPIVLVKKITKRFEK